MTSIRLASLTKRYGALTVVDRVSFAGERGEFVTLLGPSGCGKTTTLRMIAGFVVPTNGHIEIGEREVTRVPPNRRDVALVFQNYALFPHMTVADNVAFGLRMRGMRRSDRDTRVAQALEMVKLRGYEDRFPKALSGGQQQRVALARALVINPQLLLLDEPFGALDKQLRDHMRDELRVLQRRLGIATVFVTHDQQEALALSDRIIVMNGGRIEQIGAPADIYERPRTRFVAEFLGRSNLIGMTVGEQRGDKTQLVRGGLNIFVPRQPLSRGAAVTVMVRPESLSVTPAAADAAVIRARIVSATYLGASTQLRLVSADGLELEVLGGRSAAQSISLEPGVEIGVQIDPAGLWILDADMAGAPELHTAAADA